MNNRIEGIIGNLKAAGSAYLETARIIIGRKISDAISNSPANVIFACDAKSICDDLEEKDFASFQVLFWRSGYSRDKADLDKAWQDAQKDNSLELKNEHARIVAHQSVPDA